MIAMDEQLWVPKSSDLTYLAVCNKSYGNKLHPNYQEVRTSKTEFIVKHYAGTFR